MHTDDDLIELIRDSCVATTESIDPPAGWTERIRRTAGRRRRAAWVGVAAVSVGLLAAAGGLVSASGRPAARTTTVATQPAALTEFTSVPASDPVATDFPCLPDGPNPFLGDWAAPAPPHVIYNLVMMSADWNCYTAAFAQSDRHPETTEAFVRAGLPTMYVAPPAGGVRLAYYAMPSPPPGLRTAPSTIPITYFDYQVFEVNAAVSAQTEADLMWSMLDPPADGGPELVFMGVASEAPASPPRPAGH